MNLLGTFNIISFKHILTPIASDCIKCELAGGIYISYRIIYIFGIRIVRWSVVGR